MANTSDVLPSDLPNPFTPMAWLDPDVAYQKTIATYVLVAMLGVLVWDIVTHLGADWILLTRYRINLPTIIYYLSRFSSLLYSIPSVIFETTPIENCAKFLKFECAVFHIAVSSTALLFFFRVRAIFDRNIYITAIFLLLWLGVLGGSLTAITSLAGDHIGNTKYCQLSGFRSYGSSANIIIAIFDTCIFAAITWRLLSNSQTATERGSSTKSGFNFFGKYLPAFSKALLQDGQNYYMVAMVCNLLVLIMTYLNGIPAVYRTIFLVPSVALTNIMACRVFRHTKLGRFADTSIVSTMIQPNAGNTTIPVFVHSQRGGMTVGSIADSEDIHTPSSGTDTPPNGYSREKMPEHSKGDHQSMV